MGIHLIFLCAQCLSPLLAKSPNICQATRYDLIYRSDMNRVFPGYTTYLRYIYLVLMVYAGKMFEFLHVLTSLYGWQQYCF